MRFAQLRPYRLCYMASPYTRFEAGLHAAFEGACIVAAQLISHGVKIFAPICHSHPIAIHGGIEPLDHGIWLPIDEPLMDAAEALIVVQFDGWDQSYGVDYEVDVFKAAGKDIFYLNPHTMDVSAEPRQ